MTRPSAIGPSAIWPLAIWPLATRPMRRPRGRSDVSYMPLRIHEIRGVQLSVVVAALNHQRVAGAQLAGIVRACIDQHTAAAVLHDEPATIDLCDLTLHGDDPVGLRYLGDRGGDRRCHFDAGPRVRYDAGPRGSSHQEQRDRARCQSGTNRNARACVLPIDHLSTPSVVDGPVL